MKTLKLNNKHFFKERGDLERKRLEISLKKIIKDWIKPTLQPNKEL